MDSKVMWPTVTVCSRQGFLWTFIPTLGIFRQAETSWSPYPEVSSPPHSDTSLKGCSFIANKCLFSGRARSPVGVEAQAPCPGWLQRGQQQCPARRMLFWMHDELSEVAVFEWKVKGGESLIRTTKKKYKFAISFSILECLHMLLNKTPAELSTKEYKFELRGTTRKLKF